MLLKEYVHTNRAFQFTGELTVKETTENPINFNANLVWTWLKEKFNSKEYPANIPKYIVADYFRKTLPGTNIETFYRADEVFCCQIDETDCDVAGRAWTTEIEIALRDEKVLLGVKVTYTTPKGNNIERDKFSIPRFLRTVVDKNNLIDVRELNKVLKANSQEKLEELYYLITDEKRIFPVVVFTDSKDKFGTFKPIVEPEILLPSVGLIAHVAYIPGDWTRQWKELVGEGWDVYNGAVRTYNINVNFDDSDFLRHPLLTAQRIQSYEYTNSYGEEKTGSFAFIAFLIEKLQNNDGQMRIDWKGRGHKFLNIVRREAELARINADFVKVRSAAEKSAEKKWEEFYAEEITDLENARDKAKNDLTEANNLNDHLKNQLKERDAQLKELHADKNAQIYHLTAHIEKLQQKLNEAGMVEEIIPPESECTCKKIPNWIDTYFAGKLYLTSRAKRSLKKFAYEKPRLIYEWLQFLGTEYRQNRMGELDMDALKAKAADIGIDIKDLSESPISDTRRGEQGDEYYVDYNGKKIPMEHHIGKGSSTEERYTFRIYYYWDEDNSIVVICDLTNHLETRAS